MFFLSNIALLLAGIGLSSARPSNETLSNELPVAREYFYVGGSYVYVEKSGQHIFSNQMYVEKLIPSRPRQPYPLVLIHGNGQTGTVSTTSSMMIFLLINLRTGLISLMVGLDGLLSSSRRDMLSI